MPAPSPSTRRVRCQPRSPDPFCGDRREARPRSAPRWACPSCSPGAAAATSQAGAEVPQPRPTECAAYAQYGDLSGTQVSHLHLDRLPRGPAAHRLVPGVRGMHRRPDRLRGLQGVRGAAAGEGPGRIAAGHRLRPAARPAQHAGHPEPRRGEARPAGRRGERRPVLLRDLQVRGQRRRHPLRRPARLEREVLRLVLAAGLRGEGLRRPADLGRDGRAVGPDRRRRRQALVRRHRLR